MAIIIPSNKIYNIQNKKIVENAISQIEVSQNNVELKNDSEKSENLSDNIDLNTLESLDDYTYTTSDFKKTTSPGSDIAYGNYILTIYDNIDITTIKVDFKMTKFSAEYSYNEIAHNGNNLEFIKADGTKLKVYDYSTKQWASGLYRWITISTPQNLSFFTSNIFNGIAARQLQILSGFELETQFGQTSIELNANRDNYYITGISPTVELSYEIKDSNLISNANYNTSNINFANIVSIISYTEHTNEGASYSQQDNSSQNIFDLYKDISISLEQDNSYIFSINLSVLLGNQNLHKYNKEITKYNPNIELFNPYVISYNAENHIYHITLKLCSKINIFYGIDLDESLEEVSSKKITTKKIELSLKEAKIVYNETNRYVSSSSETKTLSIENEGDKKISVSSNPFIRVQNEKNGDSLTDTIYNETLNLYQNGKEQAKILCSIGNYFDENDNLAVSTANPNKMMFDLYDEVVPTYNTPFGDAPLSLAENGNSKLFKVLGSNVYFDGAVWQELTLQESGTFDGVISNGSKGLAYEEIDGKLYCTGIGTCTDTEITIASLVNGTKVVGIYESAFSNNLNITKVYISNGITVISGSAFRGCTNLDNIYIPSSVDYIGSSAFYDCISIKNISLPENITNIENSIFRGCKSIKYIKIPESVTYIGSYAFSGCSALTSITIPESVTYIGRSAFFVCSSIESITLPFIGASRNATGYTSHFGYIFGYSASSSPSSDYHINDGSYYYTYNIPTSLKSVTITGGITTIPSNAFRNCSNLTSVTIGNGVTSIGDYAFNGCSKLTSVTIGNSVTSIGDYAFLGCYLLNSLVIPNSLRIIGAYAFFECTQLSINIGNNITNIGDYAFVSNNIQNLNIGKNMVKIGKGAFQNIVALNHIGFYADNMENLIFDSNVFEGSGNLDYGIDVYIDKNVTRIPDYLFYSENSTIRISSITLSSNTKVIGNYAFGSCVNLTDVYFGGSEDEWNEIDFTSGNGYLQTARIYFNA